MKTDQIARIAHEINRAYCASIGDTSVAPWEAADESQRSSVMAGVEMHLKNPDVSPEQSHEAWLASKVADGWTYAAIKDPVAKTHPCVMPYADLPVEQRAKDHLFKAVVALMRPLEQERERIVVAKPATMETNQAAMVPIKYVGHREFYIDGAYGTRIQFVKGQTVLVPAGKAALMLKHPDVYILGELEQAGESAGITEASTKAKEDEAEQIEALRDQITNSYTKAQLAAFAKTHFRLDLDTKAMNKAAMQERVLQLVDQFGIA